MRTTLIALASAAAVGLVCWQGAGAFPVGAPAVKEAATAVSDVKQIKVGASAAADSRTAVRAAKHLKRSRTSKTRNPKASVHN
jgi:hypothetical protein